MIKPEIIHDIKSVVGECPIWNSLDEKLYWIDILSGVVYRYDPKNSIVDEVYRGDVIGGYTIQQDGSLLLFMEEGAIKIWKENKLTTVVEKVQKLNGTRFNDVIADPVGRVFCGTMPDKKREAYLYRLELDGSLTLILEELGLSNGMGFTPDKKKMYFTDSKKGEIYIFDYDKENGSLSNKRLFHKITEEGVEPDGLTVDAEGYVWSAQWNGRCIKRLTPDGQEDLQIFFPAKKITSMTFAGSNYQNLYVTSAMESRTQRKEEKAGSLFRLDLKTKGLPEHFSRVCL